MPVPFTLHSRNALLAAASILCCGSTLPVQGQDTRTITEPTIPPTCTILPAQLQAVAGNIAASDEARLDTDRIQKAIDRCQRGMAVELQPSGGNDAFLSGPLEMRSGVTLLVDRGITLYASRDPRLYDLQGSGATPGLCGTIVGGAMSGSPSVQQTSTIKGGCRPLIGINDAHAVSIMGAGIIDGRGDAQLLGKTYSWWQMARKAEPGEQKYFSPRLIGAKHADGLILYRITLHNSMNFHVSVNNTDGFTAWNVHLLTPTRKGVDARNTDGIDPGNSRNITVAHSWIDNGDDNIAIKTGVTHMSVLDNHFYTGHGMSIGSETYSGQSFLLVDGLTEDHTTSGIRIKSNVTRGGLVHDVLYQNICMRDVKVPISISPFYANHTTEPFEDPRLTGNRIPDYKAITIRNVVATTPGDVLIAGFDDAHHTEITLDGLTVLGATPSEVHGHFATVTLGPGGTNLDLSKADIRVVPSAHPAGGPGPETCRGKFLPMR